MSEYISRVVAQDLLEGQEDSPNIHQTLDEPTIPFDQMLKELDSKDG